MSMKCHKVSGGSCIDSPDWIKKKRGKKNTDD